MNTTLPRLHIAGTPVPAEPPQDPYEDMVYPRRNPGNPATVPFEHELSTEEGLDGVDEAPTNLK